MSAQKKVTAIKSNADRGIIAGSKYVVMDETPQFFFLQRIGKVSKSNFIEEGIIPETPPKPATSKQFAKCNVKNAYKNLTVGKEYEIVRTEKDGCTTYYHILNDAGASARYNSKFFTQIQTRGDVSTTPAIPEKSKAPEIKKGYALCNDGGVMGLKTGEQYQIVKDNVNTLEIMVDGKKGLFLKSRFIVGK